ncbi:MAG: TonB-dependent receptor [Deltaproteobacteria bacterium]|jgi:vitamin B12 transporter|nr:TonB-dependent receptor [Deltaproteobacteria bacterium]
MFLRKVSLVFFVMILVCAMSQYSKAQESTMLDAIVVTAGRVQEELKELPQVVDVVEGEELERIGANNLGEALRYLGVQVTSYAPSYGLTKIIIRGFTTSAGENDDGGVLLMLDGRKFGNNNLAQIGTQNIQRIEVIRGTASMQYGADAIGGVINVITKRGTPEPHVGIAQTVGSANYLRSTANFSGQFKGFDLAFGASTASAENFHLPDGNVYLNTGNPEQHSGNINFGYNFTPNYRLGFNYTAYRGLHYANGGNHSTNPYPAITSPYNQTWRDNHSWDLLFEGKVPAHDLSFSARYYTGATFYDSSNRTTTSVTHYSNKFKGVTALANWENKFLSVTAGFDYYKENYFKSTNPKNSSYYNQAGWLISRLKFLEDTLFFSLGARYDKFFLEAEPNPVVPFLDQTKTHFTPSFGVSYLPTDWLRLRGNVSTAFKMPTPSEIFAGYPSMNTYFVLPNPDLVPENAFTWEIGADVDINTITLGLTYFQTKYTDKLQVDDTDPLVYVDANGNPDPTGKYFTRQYHNLDNPVYYKGFEGNFNWNASRHFGHDFDLKPYLAFTVLTDMSTKGERVALTAYSTVNYGVTFADSKNDWRASLDVTRHGVQNRARDSDVQFGPYTVIDLNVSKDLLTFGDYGKLRLDIQIANLNNVLYEKQSNYYQPGRSFYATLRYDY